MYLKTLKLTNFRCYSSKKIDFSKGVNILLGENAVGKTSVVESISYLSIGKSHKTINDQEVIKLNNEYALIYGDFSFNNNTIKEIFVGVSKEGKKIKRNGNALKSISEHLGLIYVVVFAPEDLDSIVGSPAIRRKFLDLSLSQIDKSYLRALMNYKKLLKERNEVLKNTEGENLVDKSLLEVLTKELVKYGVEIINKRRCFIDELNLFVNESSSKISGEAEKLSIEYKPNIDSVDFYKKINDREGYDLYQKTTTIGPHRDDFIVTNGDMDISIYGSQGQIRTAALSLKLGLSEYYKSKNKDIIIILDDVFSELDKNRQNRLVSLLGCNEQVFITTTSIDELDESVIRNSNIIRLERDK